MVRHPDINRRGNIAALRWDQRCSKTVFLDGEAKSVDGFELRQGKTGKRLFLPITPILSEVLEATPRQGETVLVTAYGEPFSPKSLTGRMADWTASAKLPKGFTLHGLRKTLGKILAEGGASTRQIMDTLGHDDIAHAELYTREAEQARLATDGMSRVVRLKRNG
ncbi:MULTISPECIES: tyrosine-type recombinase/integrase [unclassified Brucella]|uniref:tyrosine-type recombinase/integrase n=1 Tax=Brucella amazoniensis TaxID=2837955 RepID=UPI00384A8230